MKLILKLLLICACGASPEDFVRAPFRAFSVPLMDGGAAPTYPCLKAGDALCFSGQMYRCIDNGENKNARQWVSFKNDPC